MQIENISMIRLCYFIDIQIHAHIGYDILNLYSLFCPIKVTHRSNQNKHHLKVSEPDQMLYKNYI